MAVFFNYLRFMTKIKACNFFFQANTDLGFKNLMVLVSIACCQNKSNNQGYLDPVGSSIYQNPLLYVQIKRHVFKRAHLSFAAQFPQPQLQPASWLLDKYARKIRKRRKASEGSILKAAETFPLARQLLRLPPTLPLQGNNRSGLQGL